MFQVKNPESPEAERRSFQSDSLVMFLADEEFCSRSKCPNLIFPPRSSGKRRFAGRPGFVILANRTDLSLRITYC